MMLYHMYESTRAATTAFRAGTQVAHNLLNACSRHHENVLPFMRHSSASFNLIERLTRYYAKPAFDIETTQIDGVCVDVSEDVIIDEDFYRLVRFRKSGHGTLSRDNEPKILLVAPMSGHHATLLRDTVQRFLPHFDVYITDWLDPRDIPLIKGDFDLDDYIDALITMLNHVGDFSSVIAVCQPAVPVLAALSLMAEDKDPTRPHSMVLMGGPIDARRNPTLVNDVATNMGFDWFRNHCIQIVPAPYAGMGRRVYPGFLQLASFMNMNLDRHVSAYQSLFEKLVEGDQASVNRHDTFYDEYRSVMDLTGAFYLQTLDKVFIRYCLPMGTFKYRDRLVIPSKITDIALMTVEGARDDISGPGQTEAAHDLCTNIPDQARTHRLYSDVGHYGLFSGRRFSQIIAPEMIDFIMKASQAH